MSELLREAILTEILDNSFIVLLLTFKGKDLAFYIDFILRLSKEFFWGAILIIFRDAHSKACSEYNVLAE